MNIVLRHRRTGRYYNRAGRWVRRADNALVFDDVCAARDYSKNHQLDEALPVQRLAPYMMALLRQPGSNALKGWARRRGAYWYLSRATRFSDN
jgi:hypothetical protein